MLKRFSFFLTAAALCAAPLAAQQSVVNLSVTRTDPNDGKQMYVNYCAPCHGVDGRGHGPVAKALIVPPTDLTAMSRNHHGSYPDLHVAAILKFGVNIPAHGSQDMPVWGTVLRSFDPPSSRNEDVESLRISNIVRYIKTLQTN